MHLQEIFDLTLTQGHGKIKQCPLHHVPYVPAKFEVTTANGSGDAFTRKYPKVKGVKVTRNVAQYPRHHVTYAPAKFYVATFHGK